MVIVLLAVGIGATSAMYSLINQVILAPLPVPEPDELVSISAPGLKPGQVLQGLAVRQGTDPLFSYPMFRDFQAGQSALAAFSGLAAHYDFIANLAHESAASYENGALVSGDYFEVLKVRPALGRLIGPQDDLRVGEGLVTVLSYAYWRDRLGADPNVIGKAVTVNGQVLTVVGVAPEGFNGMVRGFDPTLYVPLTLRWLMQPEQPRDDANRQAYWVYLFGRLKPGVSREQAEWQLDGLYRSILANVEAPLLEGVSEQEKAQYLAGRIVLEPGARGQVYTHLTASNPLTMALGVTVLVLLIVCGNVANLLLARGASRAGEMAIRAALGADRRRLVAQLLTESAVLAAIGGALSLPVAFAILQIVTTQFPRVVAGGVSAAQGSGVIVFAAGTVLAAVILFGLVPALSAGRADAAGVIKAQSAQSPGGRGVARLRNLLATSQISLSLVLLVLAGLFTRSLINVARDDRGIDIDSLVSVTVSPVLNGLRGERLEALHDRMREELSALPGVDSVASIPFPIFTELVIEADVTVAGSEQLPDGSANMNPLVSPGFFETFSIPLLAGRDFTDADGRTNPNVVIANESFVRKFGLGPDALGKTLRLNGRCGPEGPVEIIGVVADAQHSFVKGPAAPQVYTPRRPFDTCFSARAHYVRSDIDPNALTAMIQRLMQSFDPTLAAGVTPVAVVVKNRTSNDRLMSLLSATFAGLATALAAIGLYGVLAFNVTERRRELGLRLALGASPGRLRLLVLKQVGVMASIGGAVGLAAALGGGRLAQAALYGVSGFEPLIVLSAVAALAAVLLVAGYVPARRASSVAPMEALRFE
jgi:predicted permease